MSMLDSEFIRHRTLDATLRDGTRARLRPVVPEDKERLVAGLERLSPASRYRRFMTAVARIPERQLRYFTELDYVDHYAVGALSLDEPGAPGMGIARYVRLADQPEVAEVAVTIVDEYQKSGLGTLLLHALMAVAAENGITQLQAEILGDNYGAIRLVRRFGAYVARKGNPCLMAIDVPAAMQALRGTEHHDQLVALARGEVLTAP